MSESTRVAFVLPTLARGNYWHPVFRILTSVFPNTRVFTQVWPGFVRGHEGTFRVRSFAGRHRESPLFVWGSPRVIPDLVRFRPQVVFTSGFHIWALYVLLLRFVMNWRVILLWDGISPSVAKLQSQWRMRLRRLMARSYDLCLTNTQEGYAFLRDSLNVPPSHLACYPYEVPDIVAMNQEANLNGNMQNQKRPVFLFAGMLLKRKGLDYLLKAAHSLIQQDLRDFSLLVVGSGPDAVKVKNLAIRLGLEEHVTWHENVPYHRMGAYYSACDVFVFPTREDVWGMVALEAMAFGKPIICSRHAGARELVRHEKNGFIVDPAHTGELADRMARFIRKPELIVQFGAVSKAIMAKHSAAAAATMLAESIGSVLRSERDSAIRASISETV